MENLPDDVLLTVMHHLSMQDLCLGARLVNRHWNELTHDLSLWKCLDLQSKADSLTDYSFLQVLSECCDVVEKINVRSCMLLSDEAFQHEDIQCPQLRKIDVSGTKITDSGLRSLVTKYSHLEKLTCLRCKNLTQSYTLMQELDSLKQFMDPYEDCADVPEDANCKLIPIFQKNPQLEEVRLSCKLLDDDVLVMLTETCRGLQTLHLPNCVWISGDVLVSCVAQLPHLKSLDISGTTVCDPHLVDASPNLQNLEEFNVSECRKISDIGIMSLVEHCPRLRCIILNHSKGYSGNISDVGLSAIGEHCSGLEYLTMCFCPSVTDAGLQHLVEGCRKLKYLDIAGCLSLTDASLRRVGDCCKLLTKLTASECVQFTSNSVNRLLQECGKLKVLELETCHYLCKLSFERKKKETVSLPVSERSIPEGSIRAELVPVTSSALGTSAGSSLSILDLSFCSKIDNDSLNQIAKHCALLRYLSLRGCCLVSDSGVETIAINCKHLQVLDICGSSSVSTSKLTDASLVAIADHSKNVVMLSIAKSPRMTTEGVLTLVERCRTLKRISLTAGPELNLFRVIKETRVLRGKCWLQDFNADYVREETKGNFLVKFPPLALPTYY